MSVLRLNVLGPPEVYHDGSRLTFALRKAQALLLYLAVEGGMHPRSKLAALLWPDSEPHAARTALRNALTLLRSLLATPDASASPHSHLLSQQDLLGLDPHAPFELDLDVVQQAYHQAQRLSTFPSQEPRAALVTQVQQALATAAGSALLLAGERRGAGAGTRHAHALAGPRPALGGGLPPPDADEPATPPSGRTWPRSCASSPRRRPWPWRTRFAPARRPAEGAPLPVARPWRAGHLAS